ncbi:MAG: hypothetical protein GIKADHBN_00309 [Phycisphaerales bacterium]|nr:hypothetical protein [Phycisphaerales bacterium]
MFRVASHAMRPQRWVLAAIAVVLAALVIEGSRQTVSGGQWHAWVATSASRGFDEIGLAWGRGDLTGVAVAIGRAFRTLTVDLLIARPTTTIAIVMPLIIIWSVSSIALARMTAVEFGQGALVPWTQALGFAVRRWVSGVGAVLLAPLTGLFICLGLAAAGWVLLQWPVVEAFGSLLYPLAVLASLAAVLLVAASLLAHHLFCPAIACESADALDAFQRGLAYLVGSPGRSLLYAALGALQTVIAAAVVWFIGVWTTRAAFAASYHWVQHADPGQEPGWSERFAAAVVSLCSDLPSIAVAGLVFSGYAATSTIAYLLLREHNDGQDAADLWMPGLIDGTLAETADPQGLDDDEADF